MLASRFVTTSGALAHLPPALDARMNVSSGSMKRSPSQSRLPVKSFAVTQISMRSFPTMMPLPDAPERHVCEDELAGDTIAAVDDMGRTVDDDDLGRRRHGFLGRGASAGTQQNEPGPRALNVGDGRRKTARRARLLRRAGTVVGSSKLSGIRGCVDVGSTYHQHQLQGRSVRQRIENRLNFTESKLPIERDARQGRHQFKT